MAWLRVRFSRHTHLRLRAAGLVCLWLVLIGFGNALTWAQEPTPTSPETPSAPASTATPSSAAPTPSSPTLNVAPIPTQFSWLDYDIRGNTILETLLGLQTGQPSLLLSFSLMEDISDNFFRSERDRQEEFQTSFHIGTIYRIQEQRGFLSLANTVSVNYRAQADTSRVGFANLALNAGYTFSRLSLALTETLLRDDGTGQANQDSSVALSRQTTTFLRHRVNPQVRYEFTPNLAVQAGYAHTLVLDEGQTTGDTMSHTFTAGLQYAFSRALMGTLRYTFTTTDNSTAADSQVQSASGDLAYALRRDTDLIFRLFGARTDRDGGIADTRTYGFNVGVRRALTPELRVFVALGPVVFEREGDAARVRLNWQVDLNGALPLFRTANTSITLSTRQNVEDTSTEVNNVGTVLRQSVGLQLNYEPSRVLQTGLFVDYTRTQQFEDIGTSQAARGREDHFWSAGARARYALTKTVFLAASYRYQRRDTNLSGSDYDENRVTLSVTAGVPVF